MAQTLTTDKGSFGGDKLSWVLEGDGTLTISGEGAMEDWYEIRHCFNGMGARPVSNVPWSPYGDMISRVIIDSGVTSVGDVAFCACGKLKSAEIADSVTSIGDEAFAWCGELESVTIPRGVREIGELAFYGCACLKCADIPDSVTKIGRRAFANCRGLESISVSDENSSYTAEDGVLFNRDKTALIRCPAGKRGAYRIPESVGDIMPMAFEGCHLLSEVCFRGSEEQWADMTGGGELPGIALRFEGK